MLPLVIPIVVALQDAHPQSLDGLAALDRATQAAAVAELADCPTCDAALVELWTTTNRFDVRAHIARVFVARGPAGAHGLRQLAQAEIEDREGDTARLLIASLVSIGPPALDIAGDEHTTGVELYALARAADELGVDALPIADRLLALPDTEVRLGVIYHWLRLLPVPARAQRALALARDDNDLVRGQAGMLLGELAWTDADRAANPEASERYATALTTLLDSDNEHVVRGAIAGMTRNNVPIDPQRLMDLALAEQRWFWARVQALSAYLAIHDDARSATAAVLDLLPRFPLEACIALATIDESRIPTGRVPDIVAVLPQAQSRDLSLAGDLLAPLGPGSQPRVGVRAIPALTDAVRSDDDTLAGLAAETLAALGPHAASAIPTLIARLGRDPTGWHGYTLVRAALAIAPDDPRVHATLTSIIQNPRTDPSVAGNALRDLRTAHPDAPWVAALARPALASPDHPLHDYAIAAAPPRHTATVDDIARFIAELHDTTATDTAWAFANGDGPDTNPPGALLAERDRRLRAAYALRALAPAHDAAIIALIGALKSPVTEFPRPPEWHEDAGARRRASVWHMRHQADVAIAASLARIIHLDADAFARAVEALRDHPAALGLLLSSPVRQHNGDLEPPRPPADLTADQIRLCEAALWPVARTEHDFQSTQANAILALARLPGLDAERLEGLRDIALFGQGHDGPPAAIVALGRAAPHDEATLALIRGHADDPRRRVRDAARAALDRP
jgi:hypothetical protein